MVELTPWLQLVKTVQIIVSDSHMEQDYAANILLACLRNKSCCLAIGY